MNDIQTIKEKVRKYEKRAFLLKVLSFTISIVVLAIGIVTLVLGIVQNHEVLLPLGITFTVIGGVAFIFSIIFVFGIKIRRYVHKDLDIWVYSGFAEHLLVVNDELLDRVHLIIPLTDIEALDTTYKGYKIDVKMNFLGINVRVNGKVVECQKIKGKKEAKGE